MRRRGFILASGLSPLGPRLGQFGLSTILFSTTSLTTANARGNTGRLVKLAKLAAIRGDWNGQGAANLITSLLAVQSETCLMMSIHSCCACFSTLSRPAPVGPQPHSSVTQPSMP
ncbi:hypothetical protein [Agrobacterium albertimagni]|uniref:hypothetical protein n=1 Tax=Agrobacterium albertimagni TaxID=147266 RepID=UPI0012FD769F|nr:hypothetical protein [Agrobacterium albertimagni]